jgi:hypothetical protein
MLAMDPPRISPGWPERGIEPHIPVFDKSARSDGFATPREGVDKDDFMRYRASKHDCDTCSHKPRCCPGQPDRKIPRSIHEGARDMARDLSLTDAYATSTSGLRASN